MNRSRSWVWNFYNQPNPATPRIATCKACNTVYSNGSVERMQKHLKNCKMMSLDDQVAVEAYCLASPAPSAKRKMRIRPVDTSSTSEPSSSMTFVDTDKANVELVKMLLSGQFPLSMIDNESFILFLTILNPSYSLPNRNYLLLHCFLDPGTRGNKLTALERNDALRLIRQQLANDPRFGHELTTEARDWLAFKGDYAIDTTGSRSEAWLELNREDAMDIHTWWSVFFPDKKLGQLISLLKHNMILFTDAEHVSTPVNPTNFESPSTSLANAVQQQVTQNGVTDLPNSTTQESVQVFLTPIANNFLNY